jgi:hypothetical protein
MPFVDIKITHDGVTPEKKAEAIRAVERLADDGKARMPVGKPRGARGLSAKGKPLSDTVIEDRR